MISWKRIHQWMVKALEEPFFRAEMHRVDMLLPDAPAHEDVQFQVIEGGKKDGPVKNSVELAGMERVLARN
ncbi:MAG: hypothetical protein K6T29_02030 [Peptococcaceae bacterium]|nr:hypothetical protein [Peptococcaceae bacterium]